MSGVAHEFPPCRMSFEEFAEWIPTASSKHEFLRGVVYGMAGGTDIHSMLSAAILAELRVQLKPKGCIVHTSDMLIKTPKNLAGFFPDASVVCGPRDPKRAPVLSIDNPCIVVEVLSKATRNYDQGDKLLMYKSIPSLLYYILIDSRKVSVQLHSRQSDRSWIVTELSSRTECMELPVYQIKIGLMSIYEDVEFDDFDDD